jgi:hypothetical protein
MMVILLAIIAAYIAFRIHRNAERCRRRDRTLIGLLLVIAAQRKADARQ